MLEADPTSSEEFSEALNNLLEKLLELKSRPKEVTQYDDRWFEAMAAFVCETFLYIIATLLKRGAYGELNNVFTTAYLIPETEIYGEKRFQPFVAFWGHSNVIGEVLRGPNGERWLTPTGELFKRQATRQDINFDSVMEADFLCCLMSLLGKDELWFPHTSVYARWSTRFPLFIRSTQRKGFSKLAQITGVQDPTELMEKLRAAIKEHGSSLRVGAGYRPEISFEKAFNLDNFAIEG